MTQERIDNYFLANSKYFPVGKIGILRSRLATVDDSRYEALLSVELKEPVTMLLISLFLGSLGVDRFMLGDMGMGVLKLLTGGLCGILTMIDWFTITQKTKDINFNNIMAAL